MPKNPKGGLKFIFNFLRKSKKTGPTFQKTISFETLSAAVEVRLRPCHRTKSFRLSHAKKEQHFILSYPAFLPEEEAYAFLHQQKAWMDQTLQSLPAEIQIGFGQSFSFFGKEWTLAHDPLRKRGVHPVEGMLFMNAQRPTNKKLLLDFLKKEARSFFEETSHMYATQLGVQFKKISVRDTCTRWGSCSSAKALSYSWRLGFAPLVVAQYVVAHEVAHLRHMNHSSLFWDTVGQLDPHYKKNRTWLKKEGMSLMMTSFDLP